MATPTYDQQTALTGKLVDSENEVIDLQQFLESGEMQVTATDTPTPVVPVAEATVPKYENRTPWASKMINSENLIIDLIQFLKSGQVKMQVSGAGNTTATYITKTDETSSLPNSTPLSGLSTGFMSVQTATGDLVSRALTGTVSQIEITNGTGLGGNPVFSLPLALILPGSMQMGGDLKLSAYKVTSASGTPIQLVPDNDADGIDLSSNTVRIEQDLVHAGETTNKISFTTGAQNYQIGGSSIFDINSSGLRLGATGARLTSFSNSSSESSATMGMTAQAIQGAIAAAIASSTTVSGYIWMNTGNWTGQNFAFTTSYKELTSIGTNFSLAGDSSNFAMTTDGRLKYTGAATIPMRVSVSVILEVSSGNFAVKLYKNGVALAGSEVYVQNQGAPIILGFPVASVATNDYFSVWIKRSANNTNAIMSVSLSAAKA